MCRPNPFHKERSINGQQRKDCDPLVEPLLKPESFPESVSEIEARKKLKLMYCGLFVVIFIVSNLLLYFFVAMPIVTSVIQTSEMTVVDLNITAIDQDTMVSSSYTQVKVVSPPPVDLPVVVAPVVVQVYSEGAHFGWIYTEQQHIATSNDPILHLHTTLHVTNRSVWNGILEQSISGNTSSFTTEGTLDITVFGFIPFSNIPISDVVILPGLRDLTDPEVTEFLVYVAADQTTVLIEVHVMYFNPTFIFSPLGDIVFDSLVDGYTIALARSADAYLLEGVNNLVMTFELDPSIFNSNNPGAVSMFSNYLCGRNTTTMNVGKSSSIPLISDGLKVLELPTTIPGANESLLLGGLVQVNLWDIINTLATTFWVSVPVQLAIKNPMDAPSLITEMDFGVIYSDTQIMVIKTTTFRDGTPLRIEVPPRSTILCDPISAEASIQGLGSLYNLLVTFFNTLWSGYVEVETSGELVLEIGAVELRVEYELPFVPLCTLSNHERCNDYFSFSDTEIAVSEPPIYTSRPEHLPVSAVPDWVGVER